MGSPPRDRPSQPCCPCWPHPATQRGDGERADDVYVERKGWLERVGHGLFEGEEEAVLHVMGWLGGAPGSSQTRTSARGRGRASAGAYSLAFDLFRGWNAPSL
jgi:hypothetical protein